MSVLKLLTLQRYGCPRERQEAKDRLQLLIGQADARELFVSDVSDAGLSGKKEIQRISRVVDSLDRLAVKRSLRKLWVPERRDRSMSRFN